MEIKTYLKLLSQKKKQITVIVFIALLITSLATFLQPLKYGSSAKVLILQNYPLGSDYYSVSKSNEALSNLMAEVVSSSSFYEDVLNSGYNIDKSYFTQEGTGIKELKAWKEAVEAYTLNDKGILEIKAYHKDKNQLSQIAQAVNYVLKINHQDYHGGGSNVNVKVIEGPVYSTWYTKPNIIANYVIGLLFGLIVGMSFVYLFPNYSLNLFKRKKELKWEEDQAGKGFDPEDSHDDILG